MVTRLYFRSSNAAAGPTAKASTDADNWSGTPSDKNTCKNMTFAKASSQISVAASPLNSPSTPLYCFHRMFASPALKAQTLTGGQANYTCAIGAEESATNMNLYMRMFVYVWRSGSGNVKTIVAPTSHGTETTGAERGWVWTATGASGDFSILANDRIICEIWDDVRNNRSTNYTATIYLEGATDPVNNTSTSDAASYFEIPQDLLTSDGAQALSGSITLRKSASKATSSSITARKSSSKFLRTSITVRNRGTKFERGSVTVRGKGSKALTSSFTVTFSKNLSASFFVQNYNGSVNVSSNVTLGRISDFSQNPDELLITTEGAQALRASVSIRKNASADMRSNFYVRDHASKSLSSSFAFPTDGSKNASGSFTLPSTLFGAIQTIMDATNWSTSTVVVQAGILLNKFGLSDYETYIKSLNDVGTRTYYGYAAQHEADAKQLGFSSSALDTEIQRTLDGLVMQSSHHVPINYDTPTSNNSFWCYEKPQMRLFAESIRLNYARSKWAETTAIQEFYDALNAVSAHAAIAIDVTNQLAYMYGYGGSPRGYDEVLNPIEDLNILYEVNKSGNYTVWSNVISHLIPDYMTTYWTGTYFKYAGTTSAYELCGPNICVIIARARAFNGYVLSNFDRCLTDIYNRFLASGWSSPQWNATYHVSEHAHNINDERRLDGTFYAWFCMHAAYSSMDSTSKTAMLDLLNGSSKAWNGLMDSDLYNTSTHLFRVTSGGTYTDHGTSVAALTLFLMGIVPDTGSLRPPLYENGWDNFAWFNNYWNFNITTRTIKIPVHKGDIKFIYGTQVVTQNFPSSGVYEVVFGSGWNSVTSCTKVGTLDEQLPYFDIGADAVDLRSSFYLVTEIDSSKDLSSSFRIPADVDSNRSLASSITIRKSSSKALSSKFTSQATRDLSSSFGVRHFHIRLVSCAPSWVQRNVNASTLRAEWVDSSDLAITEYTVNFYLKAPDTTVYGPFSGTVVKDEPVFFHATYDWTPPANAPLSTPADKYDIRVEVSR